MNNATLNTAAPALSIAERLALLNAERETLAAQMRAEAETTLAKLESDRDAAIEKIHAEYAPKIAAARKDAGKGPGRPVGSKNAAKAAEQPAA